LVDLGIPWHLLFDSSSAQQARCNTGHIVSSSTTTLRKNPHLRRDPAPFRDHFTAWKRARALRRPQVSAVVFMILFFSLIRPIQEITALAQPRPGNIRLMA